MNKRYLIIFIIIFLGAFLFWSSITLQDIFFEVTTSIEMYNLENPFWAEVIFIVLAALSAMLSPFSSVPLVPAAILLWGNSLTAFLLLSGWLIGGSLTYLIGYFAGYPLVNQISSFEKIKYYQEKLSKKTEFLLILFFRFAMPAEIPGYVLGIVRYNFSKYFLATFLAEALFALITVYASEALIFGNPLIFSVWLISAFAIIALMFYLFHKKLK